jgi:hypothetical protein
MYFMTKVCRWFSSRKLDKLQNDLKDELSKLQHDLKIEQLRAALYECITVDKCVAKNIEFARARIDRINQVALAALRDTR